MSRRKVRRSVGEGLTSFALFWGLSCQLFAFERALPLPPEEHSLETRSRRIQGFHVSADQILSLGIDRKELFIRPYRPTRTLYGERFGGFDDVRTAYLSKHNNPRFDQELRRGQDALHIRDTQALLGSGQEVWVSAQQRGNKILLVDGLHLRLKSLDVDTLQPLISGSIVWDKIRPAADSRGEPTREEIARARAAFKFGFWNTRGLRLTGMSAVRDRIKLPKLAKASKKTPEHASKHSRKPVKLPLLHPDLTSSADKALDQDEQAVFFSSRIQSFAVLLGDCSFSVHPVCQLNRQCFVSGRLPEVSSRRGIAYERKTRTLVLGSPKDHSLYVYRFHSCYRVVFLGRLLLPKRIKTLTNVGIDPFARLWVSSAHADDYFNASVFFWQPEDWL